MTHEPPGKTAHLTRPGEKPVRYVDFDVFENIHLRISLRLLIALATTLIGLTTTGVIFYHNMMNKLDTIEVQVEDFGEEFKTMKDKNSEAIHNLEKNDIHLSKELEALKKEVEKNEN